MRGPGLPALGEPRRRAGAPRFPGAGRGQPGIGLPRAWYVACRWHHDVAGGDRPVLGARYHADDRGCGRKRPGRGLSRAPPLLPHRRSCGSRHHPGGGALRRAVAPVRTGRRSRPSGAAAAPSRGVNMLSRRHLLAAMVLLAAWPAAAQERLKVLATFSILGDLVRNVGGDRVEVSTLVGPDSDAHVYAPSPADARKVADAKGA